MATATGSTHWRRPWRRALWALPAALVGAAVLAADTPPTMELTLRPGDTLTGIASRYLEPGHHWRGLQRLNRISDPRRLRPGASLLIPLDWLRWSTLAVEVDYVRGAVGGSRGALTAGMQLVAGDSFDVGPDSALTLRFSDGSTAYFAPHTRATLGVSRQAPLGGVRATRLDLEQGALETMVRPLTTPHSRFEVKTPRITTAVRGTRFRVAQQADGSRHEVQEGRVRVQGGAAPEAVELAGGQGLRSEGGKPGAVVDLLPAPDLSRIAVLIERTAQTLQLASMAGAVSWHWQVAGDEAFLQRLQSATTPDPTWLLTGLPDGRYHLRVRAADAQGLEGADAQAPLDLRARPEPPLQLTPVTGASVAGGAQLAWAQVLDAPAYHLQVARDARFADLVLDEPHRTGSRRVLDAALAPGSYYWRLATVRRDGGRGPFGDAASFTIVEPTALAPVQRGADGIRLSWSGSAGFPHELQVARTADFAELEQERLVIGSNLQLPDPAPGPYYVRGRIVLPDGSRGPWSRTQHFEVPAPQPAGPPAASPWHLLLILLLPLLL